MGLEELLLVVKVVQVVFYVSTSNHSIFRKNLNFFYLAAEKHSTYKFCIFIF